MLFGRLVSPSTLLLLAFAGVACSSNTETVHGPNTNKSGGGTGGSTCSGCAGGSGGAGAGEGTGGSGGTGGSLSAPTPMCPAAPTAPLSATLLGQTAAGVTHEVHINHVGYERCAPKRAVVRASAPLTAFQVVRPSDNAVFFEGTLEDHSGFSAWGGPSSHLVADFSELVAEGTFALRINGVTSESFAIGNRHLLATTAPSVLSFFKSSRADDPDVWAADAAVPFEGSRSGTANVQGGWYDASGDISKYLSHLNYSNFLVPQQIPLTAWALAWFRDRDAAVVGAQNRANAEAEALFGADFLVRVQDPAGYFYTTIFDGWTGFLDARSVCAFQGSDGIRTANFQAAFREGGGMAIAALARIASWGKSGSFSSAEYLAAAEKGFSHLLTNNSSYCDDGKENVIDDYTALLAATELYAATSKPEYLTAARTRAAALAARLSPAGYFVADSGTRPFYHASDAGLPVVALVRYADVETEAARVDEVRAAVAKHLAYLVAVTEETQNPFGYARQTFVSGGSIKTGFFIPHDNETGYWWQGESARLASLAAAALIGGRFVGDTAPGYLGVSKALESYAVSQLDWILGKNPFDVSMLSGFGRNNPPDYCASRAPYHGHLDGGVSNGITGSESSDASGIQWMTQTTEMDCWRQWRWVEQWLPHSTWYLVAITTLAESG